MFATKVEWLPTQMTLNDVVATLLPGSAHPAVDIALKQIASDSRNDLLAGLQSYLDGYTATGLFSKSIRKQFREGLRGETIALVRQIEKQFGQSQPSADSAVSQLEAVFREALIKILTDLVPQLKKATRLQLTRNFLEILNHLYEQGARE